MEQDFKPALYLQVLREWADLILQGDVNGVLNSMFGSHQIEKFDDVVKWGNELEEFIFEVGPEIFVDASVEKNSFWCKNMISRIRKLRAKHSLNFTFQRASDVGSFSININMTPTLLREELCFQITLLATIFSCYFLPSIVADDYREEEETANSSHFMDGDGKFIESFLEEIEPQGNVPEENSDWYRGNIAKARTLIDKCEPGFCFQSQHVESSSINLHEELVCQVRSLILMTYADSAQSHKLPHSDRHEFKKQLEDWGNEVTKFVRQIILELQVEIIDKNSDWYHNKIAESRTLIAKRHSPFPLQLQHQDVGSSSINIPALELRALALADDVDCSKELGQLFLTEQVTQNKVNIPTVDSKAHVDDVRYSKERYQIFLSFRGQDTRYSFTGFLYKALHEKGFKVFMDDRELHKGDPVAEVIMGAIENSKLSIIVFSQNFAYSTWCLDEVVKILKCKEKKKQLVWPVFYKVEPSDVRHQKNNYGKGMAKQEIRFGKDSEMVRNWKTALYKISGFNAFHYKENSGYESEFIQSILNEVTTDIRDRLQAWI